MTTSSIVRARTLATALALTALASAASAQVSSRFQVTSFSVATSAGTLSWLPGSAYQTLAVESAEAGGLGGNDWDTSTAFALSNVALNTAMAHASAGASTTAARLMTGQVAASPSFAGAASNPHFGTAMAQQSNQFRLSQAGTVTITLNYVLSASAVAGDALYTYGQAALDFAAGNDSIGNSETRFVELLTYDLPGGAASQSGSLSLTVALAGPADVGFYNLRGNAFASANAAAVPEPSAWLLMAGGIAALGMLARRRSGNAMEAAA